MKWLIDFQKPVAGRPYLIFSFALVALQYLLRSYAYASSATLPSWFWRLSISIPVMTFNYWQQSFWQVKPWSSSLALVFSMIADVVVLWLCLALAIRRARTTDRSLIVACFAIVPVIQMLTFLWLGLPKPEQPTAGSRVSLKVALQGLAVGMAICVALEVLGTLVFRIYGFALFLASPFIVGCVTAYLGNRQIDIGSRPTTKLVFGACILGFVGLLAIAVEGLICLLMAAPLLMGMAWVGGLAGRAVALRGLGAARGRAAMCIVVLPLFYSVDLLAPPDLAFDSVQSIEVAAADRDVWDAVVHMGPIPTPPSAPFRWGLAYPMSGTIFGEGVGAIRQGIFSTGIAYEQVTTWDPPRQLSFIVLSDPPSMRELSPYQEVHAPHVRGYFRTVDARFTITPLENGHTRLSLATHHELDLNPAFYWLPIAKWAIHVNKARVLAHFAQQAEAAAAKSTNQASERAGPQVMAGYRTSAG